jgi:hypothetical protein
LARTLRRPYIRPVIFSEIFVVAQRSVIGGVIAVFVVVFVVFLLVTRPPGGGNPMTEVAFVNGMQPIMAQVQNPAGADLANWRQKRAAMICQTIPGLTVTNWVGTVDKLDTTIAGGGVISIAVMPNVDFGTAPNTLLNMGSNTVISPGSPLFHTLSTLQVGDKVMFSGQLFSSQSDCAQEASVTDSGSMQNPLFITRFTSITPVTPGNT